MNDSENTQKQNEELKHELTDDDMSGVSGGMNSDAPRSGPIGFEDSAGNYPNLWYDAEKDEVYHYECPVCHSRLSKGWTGEGDKLYCGCGEWFPFGTLERVSDGSWNTYSINSPHEF